MANLDITYADLEDTAKFLDSGRESITHTLVSLQGKVSGLVEAGFRTDKASGQFNATYKELNDGITQAVEALQGMAEFLRATSTAYSDTDRELAANIRG